MVKADHLEIYDSSRAIADEKIGSVCGHVEDVSKGKFEHFTLKEIHEQPRDQYAMRFILDF